MRYKLKGTCTELLVLDERINSILMQVVNARDRSTESLTSTTKRTGRCLAHQRSFSLAYLCAHVLYCLDSRRLWRSSINERHLVRSFLSFPFLSPATSASSCLAVFRRFPLFARIRRGHGPTSRWSNAPSAAGCEADTLVQNLRSVT